MPGISACRHAHRSDVFAEMFGEAPNANVKVAQ
jgi:hypothetical protein